MATKADSGEIQIIEMDEGVMTFNVIGTTPLILNRMSQKVWQELLAPKGKKTATEKASSLKHDPIKEFRDSPYRMLNENSPTILAGLATWFKGAMGTAALDTPGAKKAQIGRLVYVEGDDGMYVPV